MNADAQTVVDTDRSVGTTSTTAQESGDAVRACVRCLYDERTPAITFDEAGMCNYCHLHERLEAEYPSGDEGWKRLEAIADKIRKAGKGKPFDVVVGVSGGCDSSYLVHVAKQLGLRPLAAHFDNTWNSAIAVENIHSVLENLGVELFTHVVDNRVYDDIYRSFLISGSPDIEAPTDIALATVINMAAEKYGIQYTFEGHSFRSEGVSPLGWLYMDGKYIESVVKEFGNYDQHRLKTYPNLTMARFLKYMLVKRIRKVRPLWNLEYDKEEVKKFLTNELGWQWYGGHHLENRFTAFYYSYYLPRRLNVDQRANGYSALIRSGQMTREEGLVQMREPPPIDPEVVEMVKKRLGFSDSEFERLMSLPPRYFWEFKTYKQTFERLRPFFWLMARMDLVPKSFYVKYTSKHMMAQVKQSAQTFAA